MTDQWLPLAERDPVPGDPWALVDLAGRLGSREAVIHDVVTDLKRIDSTGYWQSSAAAGFVGVRDGVLPRLELLAARFATTSQALRVYAEGLSSAQDQALAAREKARCAEGTIERAERELARKAAEPSPLFAGPVVPVFTVADPDLLALEDGQGELSLARRLLADAELLRDEAAGRCAAAIAAAIDDDLRDDGGGVWGGVKRFAGDLVDDFPHVDEVARFAGLASGVLGVLSLIPPLTPFLAPAAAIAGGVSLLANSTLAAAGEQGWGPAMWDALGLATFGLGRLATVGSRARAGKELTTRAEYLADVRLAARGRVASQTILTPGGTTKLATTARHLKQTSGIFARAARPFLGSGGEPLGNWRILRSAAAFWNHADLPAGTILDVAPRAARLAVAANVFKAGGIVLDVGDIASDPSVHSAARRTDRQSRPPTPSPGRPAEPPR